MRSLSTTIKRLLTQSESTTLDFKQAQYPLDTPEHKSELLKDLLAFANTTHTDAYIIIGAREEPGRRASLTGVTHHLNDADLQQLARSKTNRPLTFSYHALTINDTPVGILHIPPQQRPVYLKKDFGKLRANTVYRRQGSSTSIATPDEIAHLTNVPTLHLTFADINERRLRGTRRQLTSTTLRTPKHVPDQTAKVDLFNDWFNKDYYRDLLTHLAFHAQHKPVGIAITNTSSVTAHDVRITLTIDDPKHHITIALHAPPQPEQLATDKPKQRKIAKHALTIQRTSRAWHLTTRIPKVQPHATAYLPEPFYLGGRTTMTVRIAAVLHADNLPQPLATTLTLRVTNCKETITLRAALKRYRKTASKS